MHKLLRSVLNLSLILIASPFNVKAEKTPDLKKWGYEWEEYDSSLFYRLQSIEDILTYADSILSKQKRQTHAYSEVLASTIRKRFFHGYSYYSIKDNWIAWFAGNIVWDHLHAIVLPDDILKHPNAACSQQAIVLKECFKMAGIDYREVKLDGHFVTEGKVEGQWFLFDTNMEPHFPRGRKSVEDLLRSGELVDAYKHVLDSTEIKRMFAHPVYCPTNAPIAPKATLFQRATVFLSLFLPLLLPLGLLLYLLAKIRRRNEAEPEGVKFVEATETVEQVTAD